MKKGMIIIALSYLFNSCNVDKSQLVGIYNSPNLKNNIDTLVVYSNGKYKRKLYRKSDKKLLVEQNDHWNYDGKYFTLENFFQDFDNVYSDEKKFSTVMDVSHFVENNFGTIEINYSPFESNQKYLYRKIK